MSAEKGNTVAAFVCGLILILIGVGGAIGARNFTVKGKRQGWLGAVWAALIVIGIVAGGMSCVTTVQAKSVGVGHAFGKVEAGTYQPGLSWKAPWVEISQIDATVQVDEYFGESAIVVRTGDGMETKIYLANRWQINPDAAATIYQDYRTDDPTERFREAVIDNNLKEVVQSVMGSYNPITQLQMSEGSGGTADLSFTPDVVELGDTIQQQLVSTIAKDPQGHPLAMIIDVTVSGVVWSPETQTKINDFNTEVANTRVATQREQTAKAEAEANRALAESVSNDPNVLVSKCLDIVQDAVDNNYALPAGYTCWPGGGTGVVIPSGQ